MLGLPTKRTGGIILAVLALGFTQAVGGCGGKVVVDGIALGDGGGGSGGSLAQGSGGANGITCKANEFGLVGSIDGVAIDLQVPFEHYSISEGILASTGQGAGRIILLASACSLLEGTCATDTGLFRVPAVPLVPGQPLLANQGLWVCDAPGPTVTTVPLTTSFQPVTFASLRRLGTCPGVPVEGQLTRCDKGVACAADGVIGTVAGHPVNATYSGSFATNDLTVETDFDGRGLLLWDSGPDPSVFVMPDGTGDAGAIYCIGSVGADPATGESILGNLSRLGTCADAQPIAGSVTACIGSNG